MSLRRFLNLVMLNRKSCIQSLRRMDMSREDMFYPKPPRKQKVVLNELETVRTPAPSIRFHQNPLNFSIHHQWKMDCFGLSENKIFCIDNSGLAFLYDASLRSFAPMTSLYSPKRWPISFSVPSQEDGGGSLYIMEKIPRPRPDQGQLEAFIYDTSKGACQRHSLPPPPYVLDPGYENTRTRSHAVLGGGSHLCISAEGIGTYCFDTTSREWKHAGNWMLPFYGKAEYIPELNLWFGMSDGNGYVPCASNLSPALNGEKPELCCMLKNYYPPEWESISNTQIVSLGSGRLCTLDFFQTVDKYTLDFDDEPEVDDTFAVLTGVELLPCRHGDKTGNGNGNGNGNFRIIKHKSRIHRTYGDLWLEGVI